MLASFDRWTGQHNAPHLFIHERLNRKSYRQPRFSGTCGSDGEGDDVATNSLHIRLLALTFRSNDSTIRRFKYLRRQNFAWALVRFHHVDHAGDFCFTETLTPFEDLD